MLKKPALQASPPTSYSVLCVSVIRSEPLRTIYFTLSYLTEKTGSFAPSVDGRGLDDELDLGQVAAGSILLLGHFDVLHYFLVSLYVCSLRPFFSSFD